MNIPQHVIDRAARAMHEAERIDYEARKPDGWAFGDYDDLAPDARNVYRLYASAVLAATSKRIWDSGYEAGKEDTFYRAFGHKPTPNPYRSVNE